MRLLVVHERRLESLILALVPHWADAENLIQETKIRLWQQFDQFDPDQDFGGWARTIAYYEVLSFRNRQKRSREYPTSQEFLDSIFDEEDRSAVETDRHLSALQTCLKKLSETARLLLNWRYGGAGKIKDLAPQLGCSSDAAYKRLETVRRSLFRCVEQELSKEDAS
jgi:RNA polymerase sigma-70 factor (ECF subfamily)